jgi:hypothetical protein|tara:strand:+ start:1481 stop:1882 length:402 start_codon:yes stop_codon:yes gene_type:complete
MASDEGRIFSQEWVAENEWMEEANQRAEYDALVKKSKTFLGMPSYEDWLMHPDTMTEHLKREPLPVPSVFFNYRKPVPLPKIRKQMKAYEDWEESQNERMAIFHEMLSEKGIRAGHGSVGESHKGWGNSRQKN